MIPKIIHYCWYGGKPMSKELSQYISTFREFHPDWQIKRWDESNTPMTDYLEATLKASRWSKAANLTRWQVLCEEGGVYFDTDVQVIRPFDELLSNSLFLGFESNRFVANGIIGSIPQHPFVHLCIDITLDAFSYGRFPLSPRVTTDALKEHCNLRCNGKTTEYGDGIKVYSREFFYPYLLH